MRIERERGGRGGGRQTVQSEEEEEDRDHLKKTKDSPAGGRGGGRGDQQLRKRRRDCVRFRVDQEKLSSSVSPPSSSFLSLTLSLRLTVWVCSLAPASLSLLLFVVLWVLAAADASPSSHVYLQSRDSPRRRSESGCVCLGDQGVASPW